MSKDKCICCTCLTDKENDETGFCINGHDDWAEPMDIYYLFKVIPNIKEVCNAKILGKDMTYPYIVPMFKRLARKAKVKFKDFYYLLTQEFNYNSLIK